MPLCGVQPWCHFVCHFDEATDILVNMMLGVSVGVFLDEINI